MRPLLCSATILTLTSVSAAAQQSNPLRDSLIARAKALELSTPYVPPPGTALEHHAAGFAQIMCSAVFITGLDPEFAAENVGYFTAPYAERAKLGKPVIDRAGKAVHVTLPNGVRRTAKFVGDQGCVTLPLGRSSLNYKPIRVASVLPDPSTQAWPMGDVLPTDPLPHELDTAAIRAAVDAAFQPAAGMTAAFVVTWKGRIIGERYGAGITARTPLESWSMGKSLTAALLGILIKHGVYALEQPAPIPEWQGENDPRAKIRIRSMVMETDPYGNFLTQGYELASARDWARLGNLYLQDGVWQGERILPEGFVQFVSSVAPAWAADRRPIYGGFFWINGDTAFPVPRRAYYMTGVGGQYTLIIPSHELVVVRLGHYKGQAAGLESLKNALGLLMRAVPSRR